MMKEKPHQLYQNEPAQFMGNPPSNFKPFNIYDDDQISLELNGIYDYKDRIDDDFNLFNTGMDDENGEGVVMFYSNQEIEEGGMDEEVNTYLGGGAWFAFIRSSYNFKGLRLFSSIYFPLLECTLSTPKTDPAAIAYTHKQQPLDKDLIEASITSVQRTLEIFKICIAIEMQS